MPGKPEAASFAGFRKKAEIHYDKVYRKRTVESVPRAVATLAVPTIISQVVTMIYNFADTFFIGQIGDPYMVAAVSLVSLKRSTSFP